MPDYAKLAVIALVASLGWFGRGWYDDSRQMAVEAVISRLNASVATQIASIKVENKTIYNKTVEKVRSEVQYRECKADEAMMTLTNKAITGE